jgi:hypothetical protein
MTPARPILTRLSNRPLDRLHRPLSARSLAGGKWMTAHVRIGYFEAFKSSNTLLLEADAEGCRALAEVFRRLAAGTVKEISLHDLPFIEVHHGVQLIARRGRHDRGTRRGGDQHVFWWERNADGWQDAADKLDVLTNCEEAHHYLDAQDDQVVVQVSKGEYGDGWWGTHG